MKSQISEEALGSKATLALAAPLQPKWLTTPYAIAEPDGERLMITLERMGPRGVSARPLSIIAETDFIWTGGGSGEDVYLAEAADGRTRHTSCAPQIVFRSDGSLLHLQVGQPKEPSIVADQLVTAIIVNMATRNGRIARLRARAILAIGDCEDATLPLEDIESHVAISKVAFGWMHRELRDRGRSDEVRLQAGAPFRLRGLAAEPKIAHGWSNRPPAPGSADTGDMSIDMGIVVLTARDNPILCMTAVGVSTVDLAGAGIGRSRQLLGRLGGDA